MENASKALIMAGGILIGVMILSIAAYLIVEFGGASSQMYEQMSETDISQFNSQFTKYEGRTDLRAHDIVSIANLAKNNNIKYYGDDWKNHSGETYYIQVKVKLIDRWAGGMTDRDYNTYNKDDFEKIDKYDRFLKKYSLKSDNINSVNFECKIEKINDDTKLVQIISFKE